MKFKKLIGVLVSLACLFWAFYDVDFFDIIYDLRKAEWSYIFLAIIFNFSTIWLKSLRWKLILQPIKRIKTTRVLSALLIGLFVNEILPMRVGELARAYAVGKRERLSKTLCFSSIILERILDGLVLLIILSILSVIFPLPSWLKGSGYILGLVLILVVVVIWGLNSLQVERSILLFARYFGKGKFKVYDRLKSLYARFVDGLMVLRDKKLLSAAFLLSTFAWAGQAATIWATLRSLDIALPLWAPWIVLIIINLGILIPNAPANVGVFQVACMLGLTLFSVDKALALSFSMLLFGLLTIPIIPIGMIAMLIAGFSFKEAREESAMSSEVVFDR